MKPEALKKALARLANAKEQLDLGLKATWTCNGFAPVTCLTMPPWLRMRGG